MAHIILVGAGNMGYAMLRGWITGTPHKFSVIEPDEALRMRASNGGAAATYANVQSWPHEVAVDAIIVATKPNVVATVAKHASGMLRDDGVLISVAAGISISTLQVHLDVSGPGVVRCMPNTPASIGEGTIVCCRARDVTSAQSSLVDELMSCIGKTVFIEDEGLMDAVTAVSGSGPAYVFNFVEALVEAGQKAGLPPDVAYLLASQTVYGAAKLLVTSDSEPAELRRQVTSPKGTTEAALNVLMDAQDGLGPLLHKAVEAARSRSIELRDS